MYINLDFPIKTQMFGFVRQKHGQWHHGRTLSYSSILYVTEGLLHMEIGDHVYKAVPEDCLFIPPNTRYRPVNPEGCAYYFFHFTAQTLQTANQTSNIQVLRNTNLPDGEYAYCYTEENEPIIELPDHISCIGVLNIKDVLKRASACNIWRNYSEKFLLDCYLREFLIQLCRIYQKSTVTDKQLYKILAFIHMHLKENLSLSSLSAHSGLSQSYIARLFKKNLQLRPSDYVNQTRLSFACMLLSNSDMHIGEISDCCGYHSPYYFTRLFKKFYGISPRQFRCGNIHMQI